MMHPNINKVNRSLTHKFVAPLLCGLFILTFVDLGAQNISQQELHDLIARAPRDVNTCGTGVGQTPFIINATLVSNYNGFGVSCKGICDAEVTVSVTGGVGPFTYNWVGGPNTQSWTTSCAGTQIVIVTDQGQNIQCPTTISVDDPAALTVLLLSFAPPACASVCNGSASVFAIGGVGPFDYSWNGGTETGNSASMLCAGSNTLQILDANLCSFDTTFVFNVQPILPNESSTNVSCFNACDGTATAVPTGGTGTYTYLWVPNPPNGQGTASASDLCAGSWDLTITDQNGCDTTVNFMITEPTPIIPNPSSLDASCPGECDGTASVSPTGGIGPYSFNWVPAPDAGQGTANATGLCAGDWDVTITDDGSGCDTTLTITISEPPLILPNETSTNANCSGDCDGTASVAPTGGSGTYTYNWVPAPGGGQGTVNATGLCAGDWDVTITDVNDGCDTTVMITITEPAPILPNETWTDVLCAGECTGTATVEPTGGTGTYSYNWVPAPSFGQGTDSVAMLCAGNWMVTITDQLNCDTTITIAIIEPDSIQPNPSFTNATCNGDCDGTATVAPTGGTGTYTYTWAPVPPSGQGTPTASGLCAGMYTVEIEDANGCIVSEIFNIIEPNPIDPDLTVVNGTCSGSCDGSATVNPTGGTGGFTFLWTPMPPIGQGTNTVDGLCEGPWSVTITDALGCDTTVNFMIVTPPPFVVNASWTDATCFGDCDGTADVSVSGGSPSYTYLWSPIPGTGQGTPNVTGLCPGDWFLTITDSLLCDTTIMVTISEPLPIIPNETSTDVTCAGDCDGSAQVSPTGGTGSLSFLWTPMPPSGQGTPLAQDLCAGMWTVLITDSVGCDTLVTFNIIEPLPIIPNESSTNTSCGSQCDGSASVAPTGGTGTYTYLWVPMPPVGQGTAMADSLCAGNWMVTITDSLGCDTTVTITIVEPPAIIPNETFTNASCSGICDGTASVAPTGGAGNYSFLWAPVPPIGQGTATASDLCAGSWMVTISDTAGCDTTVTFMIMEPTPILPNDTMTNETCNGPCDGTATVNPTGGAGGYSFIWAPAPGGGQGTNAATGLCAGSYSVTITDQDNCDTTVTFLIGPDDPILPNETFTNAGCFGECMGSAQVMPTGGQGGYTYLWTPVPPIGQGTNMVDSLCAGNWMVTITDIAGCDTTITITIQEAPPIDAGLTILNETCNGPCDGSAISNPTGGAGGYTFLWTPAPNAGQGTNMATGLCAGTWMLTIADSTGCDTTITFEVLPTDSILPNETVTNATCAGSCDGTATVSPIGGAGPYTYLWVPAPGAGQGTNMATGLCAVSWSVTITDTLGCDTTVSITIIEPSPITASDSIIQVSCAGAGDGSIAIIVIGGNAPYSYVWTPSPGSGQGTDSISGLSGGAWSVLITDSLGCDTTISYNVNEEPPITGAGSSTNANCSVCDGTATITVSGGTGTYTYEWLDDQGDPIGQTDTTAIDLCAGIYTIVVTDSDSCQQTFTVPVSDNTGEMLTSSSTMTSCPGDCDGTATVSFVCSDPPCIIDWLDVSTGISIGQSDTTATGLCAGEYLAQVTNNGGCISIDTVLVIDPDPIVPNASTTPTTCNGDCDGTATVGPTGGAGGFLYFWQPEPGAGQNTPQATGLCAGVWTVLITDAAGCDTLISLLIIEPLEIDMGEVVTNITCNGANDGSIQLNVTGGTSPYTYNWSPVPPNGQGGSSATDLSAGNWSVTVTDSLGCDSTATYTILEDPPIIGTGASTNANCMICDGTATITASGGSGSYTYEWFDSNGIAIGQDSLTAIDLCSGVYTVEVTDANMCTVSFSIPVSDNGSETLTLSSTPPTCFGDCDGEALVSFICSDPPCSIEWYSVSSGMSIGQSDSLAIGLCAGDYYAEVTNASACSAIDSVTVGEASPIIPNASTTPVTCNSDCDGTATVGPTGGTAPFIYVWSPVPPNGQGTPQASDLCAGIWSVLITDSLGCDTSISLLILEPDVIDPMPTITNATCAGTCNGIIALNPIGGNGGYTFDWVPLPPDGQGVQIAIGLCVGDWVVTVTDSLGCDTTVTYTILENDPITGSGSSTDATCNICDGTATIFAGDGNPPYAYEWLDQSGSPIGQDSITAIALCAGIYQVVVMDQDSCTATFIVPVSDIDAEVITTSSTTPTCPGDCDGSATVSFVCSDPPCIIEWYLASDGSSIGQTDTTAIGLCANTYLVEVINATGCVAIDSVRVIDPDPIVTNSSTSNTTCAGICDGIATVSASGGNPPYTYLWSPNPPNGQGTPQATDLCAGIWEVLITDSLGCDTTISLLIQEPLPILANELVSNVVCNGDCDGSIVLSPSGGNGPYTYNWVPVPPNGQGDSLATSLCAGAWSVTISDINLCDTTITYTITEPDTLIPILVITNSICSDVCDGTATVSVTGGYAPYNYLWAPVPPNGQGTPDVSGLCAGAWSLTVTDSLGCDTTMNFTIVAPPAIVANLVITNESCFGPCDGTATVAPTGGNGGYTYLWTPNPPNGQGTPAASGLCAGNWNILISDSLGCDTLVVFDILGPTPILPNETAQNSTCFGDCNGSIDLAPSGGADTNYVVTWSPIPPNGQGVLNATDLCPGTYVITIADGAGCDTTMTVIITEPQELVVTIDTIQAASCSQVNDGSIVASISGGTMPYQVLWAGPNSYTASTLSISDLFVGTYNIIVTDTNGCITTNFANITALLIVEANAGVDSSICEGSTIDLDGSASLGAIDYEWTDLNGDPVGSGPLVSVIPIVGTSTYILTVTNGVCVDSDTVLVTTDGIPFADAGMDQSIFLDESVMLGGNPTGPGGSTYMWTPGIFLDDSTAANPVATPLVDTWFFLTVTDINGCSNIDSVFVEVIPEVVITSGFTPNGDGTNDTWIIDLLELFPNVKVEIYNRWGELLFESVGYHTSWDGNYKDGPVPVGTYYYIINLNDPRFPEVLTGPLTVLR